MQTLQIKLKENKNKEFIKNFEKKVKATIENFNLLEKNDKIVVAASGGNDSLALVLVLKKLGYAFEVLTIDPEIPQYDKEIARLKALCQKLGIKHHLFLFKDFYGFNVPELKAILKEKGISYQACTVCGGGFLRRKILNLKAKELGATRLVTAHNADDELESIFMNLLRNRQSLNARLGPKSGLKENGAFVQRVKPFYFIAKKEIENYCRLNGLKPNKKYTYIKNSFRILVRSFLKRMERLCGSGFKIKILEKFVSKLPTIKSNYNYEIKTCEICGEPSSKAICRPCQILNKIKGSNFLAALPIEDDTGKTILMNIER